MIDGYDFRLGDWQDVLTDVDQVDAAIFDPPYGERTHQGHNAASITAEHGFRTWLDYEHWTAADVHAWIEHWAPRTRGWIVGMTSHDLIPAWEAALEAAGRYVFAPIPYVDMGKGPRMLGDGPASWSVCIMVGRPRSQAWLDDWRARREALGLKCSLPGAYLRARGDVVWTPPQPPGEEHVKRPGGKPLGLMRALIGDYSSPGDLVLDTHAGHATTGRAALELGRRFVGCERVAGVWQAGLERIRAPIVQGLPGMAVLAPVEQGGFSWFG